MSPQVSIIIPVHNHFAHLQSCLTSLKNADTNVSFEIIVVDDQSDKETACKLDDLPEIQLIRNFKNLGFIGSCNRAALNAKGDFLAFLNSDTEVTTAWLDELLDVFNRFPDVGLVGSKLTYPDGSLQECGGIVWNNATACNFGHGQNPHLQEYNYTKEVDYVSAASILIKKRLFIEIGMFDYRYKPAYYEDTDLAFKVRSIGKRVFVEPKSIVIHHEGISNGTNLESGIKKNQETNRLVFYNKWKDTLEKEHSPPGINFFRSRDRSRNKTKILVVDHYVPPFDRDAGSRCIYMYLKLLVELGLSVTFLPANFHNPQPYTNELEKLGIEILYGKNYLKKGRDWFENNLPLYQYVLLSRPNIAINYLSIVRRFSKATLLFFGHDVHHLRLEREKRLNENIRDSEIEASKKEEFEVWNESDVLLYPSKEEIKYIENAHGHRHILEVPIFFYDRPIRTSLPSFEERSGALFVANFNHPPNKDGIHWFFKAVHPLLKTNFPIHIIGSAIPEEIRAYASSNVTIQSDASDAELERSYLNCRIAIAPLRFGAGVKGKVLESLYYQLPLVTTRYGAQGIPNLNTTASIADDPLTFANECDSLYSDRLKWERYQENALDVLLQKFSAAEAKRIFSTLLFGSDQ